MRKILFGLMATGLACGAAPERIEPLDTPFVMPELRRPVFPDRDFPIEKFGARPETEEPTAGVQAAIDACHAAGGGRVVVPAGRWHTVPLDLKSNVHLHLAEGAVLALTDDKRFYYGDAADPYRAWSQDYRADPTEAEEKTVVIPRPLIGAYEAENIAITGPGTIDGQGMGWWPLHSRFWNNIKDEFPAEIEQHAWRGLDRNTLPLRAQLLRPIKCRNVLLEGFTALNAPFWMINPVACENLIIRRLNVRASRPGPHDGTPNTDGINPESCRNVLIEYCDIKTGDDAVAVKSGLDEAGRERGLPSENIVIRHVRGKRIAIGSEMSGGVRNVVVRDCDLFGGVNTVFQIKTRRGRGGVVENVWVENITAGPTKEQVMRIDMEYWIHRHPAPPEPVSERTPMVRNIHFKGIRNTGTTSAGVALLLNGLPEMPIEQVTITDFDLNARTGIVCNSVRGVRISDGRMKLEGDPSLWITDSRGVTVRNVVVSGVDRPQVKVEGTRTRDIRLGAEWGGTAAQVEVSDGVHPEAVDFQ